MESIYIWENYDNMVEFGWSYAPGFLTVFDADLDATQYHGPRYDFTPATGTHTFRMVYDDLLAWWDFKYDGTMQGFHRHFNDGPWAAGRPTAVQELAYQCDQGSPASLLNLWRQKPDGTWAKWTNTGWNCDMEDKYGYESVSDNAFGVWEDDQFFHPQRDTGCDPWAAPN